jgi:transcriptional regulator with XRE-family HTH domain
VVAKNVKRWRDKRNLDQQGLADRLAELGWPADRTAITRIERGDRRVTVDDLGLLAVALNVPLSVLLLPIYEGHDVAVAMGEASAVNRWLLFEWMIGNEPLSLGQLDGWRSGAEPLWLYERVRRALHHTASPHPLGAEPAEWLDWLQELVDAVHDMELSGCPALDLIGPERRRAIKHRKMVPSRFQRFQVGGNEQVAP